MTVILAFLAAAVGLLIGVIINALADDLPQYAFQDDPALPKQLRPPHYPDGQPRPLLAWSGLMAFLTGQRSPAGDETFYNRLSWRHPVVEVVMAVLYGGIAWGFHEESRLGVWFIFLAILMLITVIDLEHRLILFVVVIPALIVTLALNFLFPDTLPDGGDRPFKEYLIGGLLGGGVFFVMFLGGGVFADVVSAVRRRRLDEIPFGFGDVMLALLCGFMIGWRAMIFAMFITVFAGAIGALVYLVSRALLRQHYKVFTPLPYGPYIVLGTVIMLLFVDEVRDAF
ncbi:MAG: A24 family peptidase [Anaerolineae bacterium]|nr:A24 family peptidase [Anaerolineae bacterium]